MGGLLENNDQEVVIMDIELKDFTKTLKKLKPMTTGSSLSQYEQWAIEFG